MLSGQRVLVLGAGVSGIAAAKVSASLGATVVLSDSKPAGNLKHFSEDFAGLSIETVLGRQDEKLLEEVDLVILSPGVSIYAPLVETAMQKKIPVWSEIELAFHLCQAPLIAVTGTNGKTTTTTLIGEMIKLAGRNVIVGGNIGAALSEEIRHLASDGIAVAEISSFQLEAVHTFRPHIALVLNLTPDHIDRHKTFEAYQAAKEKLFAMQDANDFVVLNYDDPLVREMTERAPSTPFFFSRREMLPEGACVEDGKIVIRWGGQKETVCAISDMKLFGGHNVENALAACAAAYLAGVGIGTMSEVLRTFAGVEHRIEPVAEINGVTYYNDSKATNPESSNKALEAFSGRIILIAGGRDKNTDLSTFMALVKAKVDRLILIGEAADRFEKAARAAGYNSIERAAGFAEAVDLAYQIAVTPQVVLLSPACASYDMFDNYEQRGRVFKGLVRQKAG